MSKNPGGRPSKYNDDILIKTQDYIEHYKNHGDEIPSVVGLAAVLGVGKSTIYDWSDQEDKAKFSDMLDKLQSKQHQVLINNGLNGEFNAAITKLVLTKHGYHDRVDSDITTKGKELPNSITIIPPNFDAE